MSARERIGAEFRVMLRQERRAFARPVTCPMWRLALATSVAMIGGSLHGGNPTTLQFFGTAFVTYVLADWTWIRQTLRGGDRRPGAP